MANPIISTSEYAPQEVWKDIPGYEGRYKASNLGRIINVTRGSILAVGYDGVMGYGRVRLSSGKGTRTFTAHRVILLTFKGEPPDGSVTNHIDGDKQNNNIINLEYVTQADNVAHSIETGLTNRVVTSDDAVEIRKSYSAFLARICKTMGISRGSAHAILTTPRLRDLYSSGAVKKTLRNKVSSKDSAVGAEKIIHAVCNQCGIERELLGAKTRQAQVVFARHVAMYLIWDRCQHASLASIGLMFGKRHHSTVIHARKSILNQIETDPSCREILNAIESELSTEHAEPST